MEVKAGYIRVFRILHALIKDSLALNADAEEITTFNYDPYSYFSGPYRFPFNSNHSQFAIHLYIPTTSTFISTLLYNLMELAITRNHIGTIVGSVISTVSTLVLICGFVVIPIIDKY